MAVRLNNTADDLIYTGAIISEGDFTAMLWARRVSDRNTYSNILFIGETGNSSDVPDAGMDLFYTADGTEILCEARNYNSGPYASGGQSVTNEWFHITVYGTVATGSPINIISHRWSNGAEVTDSVNTGSLGTWNSASGQIRVGQLGDDVWSDANFQAVKIWNGVALTPAQIAWERRYFAPVFEASSCFLAWPLMDNTDTRDITGNGRSPTFTSIGTDNVSLPLLWSPHRQRKYFFAPAAGAPSGAISGATAGTATTTATLTGRGALSGATAGVATTTATGRLAGRVSGTSAGISTTSATLTGRGTLSTAVACVATTTATLTGRGALSGSSAGVATVTGTMEQPEGFMSGTAAGVATVTGTLTARGALSATVAGSATVSATLIGRAPLSGSAAGTATVSGTLTPPGQIFGSISGTSTVSGTLTGRGALSGSIAGVATVQGRLTQPAADGENTIDGQASYSINSAYGSVLLYHRGDRRFFTMSVN